MPIYILKARQTYIFGVKEVSDVCVLATAFWDLEVCRTFSSRRGVAHVALLRRPATDVVLGVPVRLAGLVRARPEACFLDLARPLAFEAGAVGVHAADRVHDVALVAVVRVPQGVRRGGARDGGEGDEDHREHHGRHHGEGVAPAPSTRHVDRTRGDEEVQLSQIYPFPGIFINFCSFKYLLERHQLPGCLMVEPKNVSKSLL